MRRFALLIAASLGTGCYTSPPCYGNGTITVSWPSFQPATGPAVTGCPSGILEVDVWMNGAPVSAFSCTDGGATITDVPPGSYVLTVEGLNASGQILYRDEFSVTASSTCGDVFTSATPGQGLVDLEYVFSPTNACVTPPSYMWFEIADLTLGNSGPTNVVAQVDDTTTPTAYSCNVPDPAHSGAIAPPFVLPSSGSFGYRLNWLEEHVPVSGGYSITAGDCSLPTFDVLPAQTTTVSSTLLDRTTSCPSP
ncbi:MAG TPA: hypothetical protein VML50_14820 [Anaeromyxobacter sp.]|nr:hypothetical protein [Anaeromyxobacter sp.]